ncbi:hypothetical protein OSB04_023925 [Centaurea solstitialis]|uniref:Reverse transcriptase domain-containing protein n=1 Tax=Centaurea solstitialis TaxID=347529 RepID=A0AA38SSP6_9ASTR|nr:hypothetical protein OSB04_023925 [Centaurea solstitialis]
MGDDQPIWGKRSKVQFTSRSPIKKTDDKMVEINKGLIKMIGTISFDGEPSENPCQHLKAFEDNCDLFNTKEDENQLAQLNEISSSGESPIKCIKCGHAHPTEHCTWEPTSLSRSEPSSGIIEQLFRQFSPEQGKMSADVEQQIQAFEYIRAQTSSSELSREHFPMWKLTNKLKCLPPREEVVEPEVELPSHPTKEVREETVRPKESATPHVPTRVPYPARLRKEKKEAQYRKFIELIKQVDINVPLVDLIAGMPNHVKFLKELVADKAKTGVEEIAFLNAQCSAVLSDTRKKDEVKVPLIFGRPFLNTASAVIHVAEREVCLGIGKDRITFSIDGTLDCDESINNLDNIDDFTEPFEIELNDHLFEPDELEESFSIEKGKDEAMGGE